MSDRKHWSIRRRIGVGLLSLLAVVLVAAIILDVVPPNIGALASHPNPAASYAEAVQRVTALQAQEVTGYNPVCKTQLLTHGQKTARVIAFAHGYTSCPAQFLLLGQKFYDLGYNVLLVPMPHHGLADRMTDDLTHLTAEELVAYADQVVDIEHGLGDRTTLAGLSGGGVATGWAAQTRADLDEAALIAPAFGFRAIPAPVTLLADNVVLLLPDVFVWWDPAKQEQSLPLHAYPRYSRHGLAQTLRAGFAIRQLARGARPAAASIIVVTNANDQSVDNAVTAQVAADWRAHGASVTQYEFPADLQLVHDLVDPDDPHQHIDRVFPKLIQLIGP